VAFIVDKSKPKQKGKQNTNLWDTTKQTWGWTMEQMWEEIEKVKMKTCWMRVN